MVLSFRGQIILAIASGLVHLGYNKVSTHILIPAALSSGLLGRRASIAHAALSEAEKRKFLNYWTSLLHSSVVSVMFLCGLPKWFQKGTLTPEDLVFAEVPLASAMFPISCGYVVFPQRARV